jgi:hypothetical protein
MILTATPLNCTTRLTVLVNTAPTYGAQSVPSYGSRDPTHYDSYTASSYAALGSPYVGSGYPPPSSQQLSRGFENTGDYTAAADGGALAGGAGGYAVTETFNNGEMELDEENWAPILRILYPKKPRSQEGEEVAD